MSCSYLETSWVPDLHNLLHIGIYANILLKQDSLQIRTFFPYCDDASLELPWLENKQSE